MSCDVMHLHDVPHDVLGDPVLAHRSARCDQVLLWDLPARPLPDKSTLPMRWWDRYYF